MFSAARLLTLAVLATLLAACRASDPPVPWPTADMLGELTADLRRHAGIRGDFARTEVLGWRIHERTGPAYPPVPPSIARVRVVLLWGEAVGEGGPAWLLVQGHRHDDEREWRRSLLFRELTAPLTNPRPGETRDGTWLAYHGYDRPPTSAEICDFARVQFLAAAAPPWRATAAVLRVRTWTAVAGSPPACAIE